MFAGGDSTRLYAATGLGLYFSSDTGDTWVRAAGVLGGLHVTALGSAVTTDHTIVYAATTGGAVGAATAGAEAPRAARTATSTLVGAGVYRYVLLPAPSLTLKLSGLKRGALKLGRSLRASGRVTPSRFARSKVKLTVQRKRGHKWVRVKSVTRTGSRTRRLQLEVQAGQARQLPRAGRDRGDDQERGGRDEVARVQGEVGGARRAGHANAEASAGAQLGQTWASPWPSSWR